MRTAIISFLVLAMSSFSVSAQAPSAKAASNASINVAAEKTAPAIVREKFDPAKDPAADLQKAVEEASGQNKHIILDVGGEWCIWCRYMDRFFTLHPDLEKLRDENFVWIKVNMSPENENKTFLSAYPAADGYPHLYVLDGNGKLLRSQDTAPLEDDKTYSIEKFTDFLKQWAPKKKTDSAPAK